MNVERLGLDDVAPPRWPPAYGEESIVCWSLWVNDLGTWEQRAKTSRRLEQKFSRWAKNQKVLLGTLSFDLVDVGPLPGTQLRIKARCLSRVDPEWKERALRFLKTPIIPAWVKEEEQRRQQAIKANADNLAQRARAREAQRQKEAARRCTADRASWGQCRQPGAIRTNPATGENLARLCIWHFRREYPAFAPPGPAKPPKLAPCPCGFGQRFRTWTHCPGCGERLPR